jgi:RNA recognition motif. (a.k.a. RRM, RBD, or RNP domain)
MIKRENKTMRCWRGSYSILAVILGVVVGHLIQLGPSNAFSSISDNSLSGLLPWQQRQRQQWPFLAANNNNKDMLHRTAGRPPPSSAPRSHLLPPLSPPRTVRRGHWSSRDSADYYVESMMMMGGAGERYELVEMPDSMCATSLFVGNLNEFVTDDELSELFSSCSTLLSLPACVVRKIDTSSMGYGFVSFPNVQEKEVRCTVD